MRTYWELSSTSLSCGKGSLRFAYARVFHSCHAPAQQTLSLGAKAVTTAARGYGSTFHIEKKFPEVPVNPGTFTGILPAFFLTNTAEKNPGLAAPRAAGAAAQGLWCASSAVTHPALFHWI